MIITPGESWSWSYQCIKGEEYLGLHVVLDDGKKYFFRTNFKVQTLESFPAYGQPFCVGDADLLNDFMDGLKAIGVEDCNYADNVSANMELALNAVACARFVAQPRRAIEHSFLPCDMPMHEIKRGVVVTLYTKDEMGVDFIVLDDEQQAARNGGIYRLMFVNREFHIGRHVLSVGAMIKVPRSVIYPFRAKSKLHSSGSNYA